MKTNHIRNMWLEFFKSKDHHELRPVSLIPKNDDSLLWINSGIATLKPYFEGKKNPPSPRLTNAQKAIRTSDIENVGVTSRHHTFFEMLGNFSIGDYFKEDAIEMAWEFLTSKKWLGLNPKKLFVTYFEEDEEAAKIWLEKTTIDKEHIISMKAKTNFWDIGLGPCGPSTEIFYDRGEKFDKRGIEILKDDLENDRYVELWNIVFSEFNNDGHGNYTPLPRKNIDTGAGLERIASILQNTPTNFETDLFMPIIKEIEKHTSKKYDIDSYFLENNLKTKTNKSFKIISDHLRSTVFAIADGQEPSNSGRGYVIRRLVRRSLTVASVNLEIKLNGKFISSLVDVVCKIMEEYYPYLQNESSKIKIILEREENSFIKIINKANELILQDNNFDSKKAFYIFETHGIPYDLSQSICEAHGKKIDYKKFNELLKKHQDLARSNQKEQIGMEIQDKNIEYYNSLKSTFVGYDNFEIKSKIIGIVENNEKSNTIKSFGIIILDKTPFYATSGGQTHDYGIIKNNEFEFEIQDVIKHANGLFLHKGKVLKGKASINDSVISLIDKSNREDTSINHSATHLVCYTLEKILDNDLPQAGAFYDKDKFRFDFKFNNKFELDKIKFDLEKEVNKIVNKDLKQTTKEISFDQAVKEGAKFMDEEIYGDIVRVVKFGINIIDLCGGTHVNSSKEIEKVLITNFEAKGSGTYRVEGLTTEKRIIDWKKNELDKWTFEMDAIVSKYKLFKMKDENLEILIKKFNDLKIKLELNEVIEVFWKFQKEENIFERKINDRFIEDQIKLINLEKVKSTIEDKTIFNIEIQKIDLNAIKKIYVGMVSKLNDEILLIHSTSKNNKIFILGVNQKNKNINLSKSLNALRNKFQIKGGGGPQMVQVIIEEKSFKELILLIIKGA